MVSFKSTGVALVSVLLVSQGVEAALPAIISKVTGSKRSLGRGEDSLLGRSTTKALSTDFKGCMTAIRQSVKTREVIPSGDLSMSSL